MRTLAWLRIGSMIALFGLAACGDDGTGGNGEGGGGGGTGDTITEQITADEGGTVEDTDGSVHLIIPGGALSEDTEITLTIKAKTADTLSEVFEFGPDALELQSPATISIDISSASIPEGFTVVVGKESGGSFTEVADSAYGSGTIDAPVLTLGTFAALLVEVPAGPCDASCMSQADAVCCTACGCEGAVTCQPVCDSATPWDCEIGCCFNYDTLECAQ